jgi:DeoR/GlpR family transcriptional regulator of sugar metabolism
LCFLGTNSIDATEGITDLEWEIIEVKKAMIKAAKKTISLAISEKLNTVQRLQVCKIEDVDIMITELDPTNDVLKPFAAAGIKIF